MKFVKLIDDYEKVMLIKLDEIVAVYYDPDEDSYCIDVKSGDCYILSSDFDINAFSSLYCFDLLNFNCF